MDGEFTGLVDALDKTAYFRLGCKSLTVETDHQPLITIINGTDMEKVKDPRQIKLKEKLMRWDLRVVYKRASSWEAQTPCPGTVCATTMTRR